MSTTDALRPGTAPTVTGQHGPPARRDRLLHAVPPGPADPDALRVMVICGNAIVREGLRSVLGDAPGMSVHADLADPPNIVAAVEAVRPAVVVLAALSDMEATVRLIRQITAIDRAPRLILLAEGVSSRRHCVNVLRAGASGYLVRDVDAAALVGAVRSVARGGAVLTPRAAQCLLEVLADVDVDRIAEAREALSGLSEREREILACVANGMGNTQIARALYMSEGSVKAYVSRLLLKLRCDNRVQVATLCRDARIRL
jgi:DNA-binding NarL/FixJ family response regulator